MGVRPFGLSGSDLPFNPADRVNPVPTKAHDGVGTAFRLSGLYRGYGDTDRESQASCKQPLAAALSLNQAKKIALHIIYCYHGNSSMGATAFFNERRFEKVYSMIGGYTQRQSELRAE